jgi:iron complex transport system substrate-binding protein
MTGARPIRVVSLLPSLTELVGALGCASNLVGVTHECDEPPEVAQLPRLTHSRIAPDASSAEIDAMVSEAGAGLYDLDAKLLEELAPDLILTQAQCDVCAVNERTVRQVAQGMAGNSRVESVNPTDLAGIFAMFRHVGDLLGARDRAEALIDAFSQTASEIKTRTASLPTRSTLLLEWLDPPFSSGHWNPEIVSLAGGLDPIALPGDRSRRLTWDEIRLADPDVVILAPCGMTLERSDVELPTFRALPGWTSLRAVSLGNIALVDGNAFFARPGPRLERSLRIAAAIIHSQTCGDMAPAEGAGWRWLGE